MINRVKRIQEKLSKENIDALLVTHPENKRYLTNFSGSTSWVIINPDRCCILVDGRYTIQASEECPSFVERIDISDKVDELPKSLFSTLAHMKVKRLGVEAHHMTLLDARKIEENSGSVILVSTTGWVECLRIKKSLEEIALIKESIALAEKACQETIEKMEAGMTESQIAHRIVDFLGKRGSRAAFDSIVASGRRSAMPHGQPTDRKIQKGDVVIIDMGAVLKGYHSDITRTVCIGDSTEEEKKVFSLLQKAQEAAYKAIRTGITGKEADAVARKVIDEGGYGDYFSHGLGHGIGLEIHEGPNLGKFGDQMLEAGMVVTVEPGVYIPGKFGMRLEDDVLVTDAGCELLTTLQQKLKV